VFEVVRRPAIESGSFPARHAQAFTATAAVILLDEDDEPVRELVAGETGGRSRRQEQARQQGGRSDREQPMSHDDDLPTRG
jgi:hypothetical protein